MDGMSQSTNKSFDAHDANDEFKRTILTVINDDLMLSINYHSKIKIRMTDAQNKKTVLIYWMLAMKEDLTQVALHSAHQLSKVTMN